MTNHPAKAHRTPARTLMGLLALGFALLLLAAACGSEPDEASEPAETSETSTDSTESADTAESSDEADEADEAAEDEPVGDDETAESSEEPETAEEPEPADEQAVGETAADNVVFADDFSQSILPIFESKCASCHNAEGPGSSHWRLISAQDAADTSQVIEAFVTSGYMPPWPAGDLSVDFHDNRSLSQDQIDALVAWSSAGGPIDIDPSTPIESPEGVVRLAEVDQALEPLEPYDGSPAKLDDYRCVIYDPQLTEQQWLRGFNFVPDQTEVVHHAIGNLVRSAKRAEIDATAAAATDGGGWECFGLPVQDDIVVAWAPGQEPTQYPEGSGILMQPGDFFVIQIHYHYEVDAPADYSQLEVDFADLGDVDSRIRIAEYVAPAEIPCSVDEVGPLCDRAAAVERAIGLYGPEGAPADLWNALCGVSPADFAHMVNGIATGSCDLPVYEVGEIVSVFGHMHEIGTKFRMTLNPDTPDELVLLDIPNWDFDWQYDYRPVDSIVLTPGDVVRIECEWDRSLIKPGQEPRYIFWSDGTTDEMCFSNIVTREL